MLRRICETAFLAFALSACTDRPKQAYYRAMSIDPATLHVAFSDTLPLLATHVGTVYSRFDDARRRPGISQVVFDSTGQLTECLESLSLDTTFTLSYRSKTRELWRGDFGLILGESTFYYAPEYGQQSTSFATVPNSNMVCAERPSVLSPAPDTSAIRLDAISLVLIASSDSGYTFTSGNYTPDGALQTYARGIVRKRPGVSPDSMRAENVSTTFVPQPPARDSAYVVPAILSRSSVADSLPRIAPGTLGLLAMHYNHGRIVRLQRLGTAEEGTAPRWISFRPSYADSVLARIDTTRTFGRSHRKQ